MIDIIFHDETGMGSAFPAQADGFEKADGSGDNAGVETEFDDFKLNILVEKN